MDIPLVSSLPLSGVAGATAIAPVQAFATEEAVIVAPLAPSLTTVDLSPMGRFLSATSLFQKKLVELQAAAGSVPESESDTFSEAAAATTAFAVAFNELQAGSLGGTDTGSLEQQSLAALFARQFGAQTVAAGGEEDTALASLASIGLRFNADPTVDPDARLTVDLPLLQVALEVDPATTTALLGRAGSAFGTLVQAGVAPADLAADGQAPAPGAAAVPLPGNVALQEPLAGNAPEPGSPALAPATPATAATPATVATPATPIFPAIPSIAPTPAAVATPVTPDNNLEAAIQAANTPVTRPAAERELADRAVELAENRRTQSASEEERAELADRIEAQDRQKADQQKVDAKAQELQRQRQELDAPRLAADSTLVQAPASVTVSAVPQPEDAVVAAPRPPVSLVNNAQQAARDPAIAAAIAAYNLSTGPFAALNARQELGAQRIKTIAPVSNVAKIAPIETQTAPKEGTRQ